MRSRLPEGPTDEQNVRAQKWQKYLDLDNLKPGRRPYGETQVRRYRSDKRRPRRTKTVISEDLGRYERKTIITQPVGSHLKQINIPKRKTGAWLNLWSHGVKIARSLKTDRIYVFTTDGEYLAEFEPMDCFSLAVKLLDSVEGLRVKVHRNIRGNVWKEYIIRSYAKWKKDHGLRFDRSDLSMF